MKIRIYSLKDEMVGFGNPVIFRNDAEAERNFLELLKDRNTKIGVWPTDHSLWYLGQYDEKTGIIDEEPGVPKLICRGQKERTE